MQPTMVKRKFSKEDKLRIIKEASEQGVSATLNKHGIYPATYYGWKKKFETMGEEVFRCKASMGRSHYQSPSNGRYA